MKMRAGWMVALLLASGMACPASAQKSVMQLTQFFRYHGDTIWVERDSSVLRVVYAGDTVTKTSFVNGALRTTSVYVVANDFTTLARYTDANGVPIPGDYTGRATRGTMPALSERDMLSMALSDVEMRARMREMEQRMADRGMARPSRDPESRPATAITYRTPDGVSITQHVDTVWYVRKTSGGCAPTVKTDTTTFLFIGDDSTRRIAPLPARTFGPGMVATLTGGMRNALVQVSLASMASTTKADLPVAGNRCAPGALGQARSGGQGVLFAATGLLRYHGDTVWREADTTAYGTVFHGDTARRLSVRNGRLLTTASYVIEDESSVLVDATDTSGAHVTKSLGERMPTQVLLSEPRMLEMQMRMPVSNASFSATGNPIPLPAKPVEPVTHVVSQSITLVQHGDTIRYITGCNATATTDTTIFVFFGADSVKRLSPPRMFGMPMVASLVGQMARPALDPSIAARAAPFASELPQSLPKACVRR